MTTKEKRQQDKWSCASIPAGSGRLLLTPQCTVSPCPGQLRGQWPMADGLWEHCCAVRPWPCSLGSAPALCLQDQGGLIKGGKATSRVSSAEIQLQVQGLGAAGTARLGPGCQQPAVPEGLTGSNHLPVSSALISHQFGIVQVLPKAILLSKDAG